MENKTTTFGKMRIGEEKPENPGPGVWLIPGFGNTGMVETEEGLVLVDMPVLPYLGRTMTELRKISQAPVNTVFLTHGHWDHACYLDHLFQEAENNGAAEPKIIGQRNILKRFKKYKMLAKYLDDINRDQFNVPEGELAFPLPERNPDIVFDQSISLTVGGIDFHAFHELGETDDALWVWVPEKKTVFSGDLVMYSFPNVGNPFKVQRYTLEWAQGLENIVAREPEILIPGHGPVIKGTQRIRDLLLNIAGAMRYLHDEVIRRLNQGQSYEEIVNGVKLPEHFFNDKFMVPRYGHPTFVVHGILRQYTGWYDGNPSNLFPPPRNEVAKEVISLATKEAMLDRIRELKGQGREAVALQLADMALATQLATEEEKELRLLKSGMLKNLGHNADSFIAKSIYYRGEEAEKKTAETL
ncbi:MAG: MBL fold metallo-hydrolase [Proteobacteria bacterium]|nr:MBL fold metallo-hydrolase [Pseudomonadota bacterium]MBU4383923.1 MBL fold metallo-hydrolase [Pseudomonadota bacterium]MCG2763563.1 MBL fold metallo-hydrolase [Desulfarculaceae bacterium]